MILIDFDNNILNLVMQKGFYPYEYMNNFQRFKEEWLSKEKLYSSLTGRKLTDKEYRHFVNAWNKSEMKTMKDCIVLFHDLYLKCNVLLLDDVFEKFTNNRFKNEGLCPSHYLSTPGF